MKESTGTARKTVVFLAILCAAAVAALCVILGYLFRANSFYVYSLDSILESRDHDLMLPDAQEIAELTVFEKNGSDMHAQWKRWDASNTNLRYVLTDSHGEVLHSNTSDFRADDPGWTTIYIRSNSSASHVDLFTNPPGSTYGSKNYVFYGKVDEELPVSDAYRLTNRLIRTGYALRWAIIPAGIVSFLAVVALYVVLLSLSARRPKKEGLYPGPLNGVPFDLLLAVSAFFGAAAFLIFMGFSKHTEFMYGVAITGALCGLFLLSLFLGLSMSAAARIKQGTLVKNTVIFRLCGLIKKIVLFLGRGLKKLGTHLLAFLRSIPLVWSTALAIFLLLVLNFFALLVFFPRIEYYFFFVIFEFLALGVVLVLRAVQLKRLEAGGRMLAEGNLGYRINTDGMFSDLKRHGEDLNRISDGLGRAVEMRMKSERMKTELITNVSHDLRTPLTSIVSYADLLSKETSENPLVKEYAEVLLRQSERLKRLIDDLVEASKAATGNLELQLAPCDAAVFLEQTAGEYRTRMEEAGLELRVSAPETPVTIRADGRRLYRVFDNLLVNILKYAQSGTRVWLTLEKQRIGQAGFAVITFRNVSRDPLNLTPDEFLERFVRGDASRSSATDGNGLGLSIAKSLTELMGGSLDLGIDGDLFKVTLRFPTEESGVAGQ
ncbi:MAG: HAMP domain-containing histidine kinase [Clostridia bacterium]|nr:HAMP domain-containing histidine kinase [Clostridia bacterium]